MTKIYRHIVFLILLLIASSAESTLPDSPDEQDFSSLEISTRLQTERNESIRIDKLLSMGIIKIRPGMTVLDIGTGIGFSAFEFAKSLKGTGKVFATDILPDQIDYIKQEARKRGLRNLYPVLVKKEGIDEFYSRHKYDLIFLCNVYHCFDKRVDYFREIRNFMAEGGELIVIIRKSVFLFQADDITDFEELIRELSQELHENKPFYERLHQSTRELIKQSKGEPDELLKKAIVDDFNQILLNPYFYKDFQDTFTYDTVSFLPEEKYFYNWLLMLLREEGSLDKGQKDLNPKEIRTIIRLNKLLFVQRFRHYCSMELPLLVADIHRQTSKFLVERELKEAGYKLKGEYVSLPQHDILFFSAEKDKEKE